ncbi:protein unc-13 homolog 4B isoform X3 [Atheta coriaria]|uniref:protein unc-13 homolog 4B isoform X3 n=1 Tax=Dalotia coriaria TaxID=877792 RepID=UPI0031F3C960
MTLRAFNYLKNFSVRSVPHEEGPQSPNLQALDGGFFETFSFRLQDLSRSVSVNEQLEKTKLAEAASNVMADLPHQALPEPEINIAKEEDGTEEKEGSEENVSVTTDSEVVASSDSETEDKDKANDYLAIAWNIDELYLELLYEILHNVGCDETCEINQSDLFSYLQDAFKMNNGRHGELLDEAIKKEAPEIVLNVEIVEAKDLTAKDSNGLSDPFVTVFLNSNAMHRYNTSVKEKTLTPVWEEHFALPVSNINMSDCLCLEVWDFDPAETVRDKLGKFVSVKGAKGVRKLLKEIAITATTGQHQNELIGKASIPLNSIPSCGLLMWYDLKKKNRTQKRGCVKVRLTFSSEKNCRVASQEHRHLLKILLLYELENSKTNPYWWCGNFSPYAKALLTRHIVQSGLQSVDVAHTQWAVYSMVHQTHPLSFNLFSCLLDKLIKPLQNNAICDEEAKIFWDSTKKLLPSIFSIIRKIRRKSNNENVEMKKLIDVLNILMKLRMLEAPGDLQLFPEKSFPWIKTQLNSNWDTETVMHEAVRHGAEDWYNHLLENNVRENETDVGKLQYLIKIITLIRSDIQKAVEFYDKHFQSIVNLPYANILYTFYQEKISVLAKDDVEQTSKSIKKLSYNGFQPSERDSTEPLAVGTTLFELYLILERFVILGQGLCPQDMEDMPIKNFYIWFNEGVGQWLEIAAFKALTRIEKAIDLDQFVPVDSSVKYSSSAIDTLQIFYQIKIFWQQLNWPDVEGSYIFMAKIIDDICRCSSFYADKMSARVEGMGDYKDVYESKFEVTKEWCQAINNIDYVRTKLKPFSNDLGKEELLKKLADFNSTAAQRCGEALDLVMYNALDTIKNKIIELLEVMVDKMTPSMKRLLIEGAELYQQDSNSIDRVMKYIDRNLETLYQELNEENFNKTLLIIWDKLGTILAELVQTSLEKRRPPSFFANLQETLKIMVKSFKSADDTHSCPALQKTERLLKLHALETGALIHQINLDLYKEQQALEESPHGQLCVRMKVVNTDLHIEILNGRNLFEMNSTGASDSFVRVHMLPEEKFVGVNRPKTQIHYKEVFPLFDEKFDIVLSSEHHNVEDALVLFSVKDYDMMGLNNQYIGEAFVSLKDIPKTSQSFENLPQVLLQLVRPTSLNTEAVKALEYRQGDKLAKEFLKKYKQKMGSASP